MRSSSSWQFEALSPTVCVGRIGAPSVVGLGGFVGVEDGWLVGCWRGLRISQRQQTVSLPPKLCRQSASQPARQTDTQEIGTQVGLVWIADRIWCFIFGKEESQTTNARQPQSQSMMMPMRRERGGVWMGGAAGGDDGGSTGIGLAATEGLTDWAALIDTRKNVWIIKKKTSGLVFKLLTFVKIQRGSWLIEERAQCQWRDLLFRYSINIFAGTKPDSKLDVFKSTSVVINWELTLPMHDDTQKRNLH